MGATQPPDHLFSREHVLHLVEHAREDLILRDRTQLSPGWFRDKGYQSEHTTIYDMSSHSGSSGIRGDCHPSPKIETLQQPPSDEKNCPGPETFQPRPPSDEHSQTAVNETQSHRASDEHSGPNQSPLTEIDTPSFKLDIRSPSRITNIVIENGLILAESGPLYVPVEEQDPGINDFMSGALGILDTPITENACDENNFLLRPTMEDAQAAMPFKLLRVLDLQHTFTVPLADEHSWKVLPDNFYIPVVGLMQAIVELQSLVTAGNEHIPDATTIRALAKHGGTSDDDVVYPENLMPLIDMSELDADWEFWELMWAQGA